MATTTTTHSVAGSCSILSPRIYLQRIRIPRTFSYKNTCYFPIATNVTVSNQLSPFDFPGKSPRHTTAVFSASSTDDFHSPSEDFAVLLEVDGVLVDAYRVGNRLAFNKAFEKLGLDCANWNEPIYTDLLRRSAGDEEKMVFLYFNRIGWPSSLPTNEKGLFTKSVLQKKEKALEEFVTSKSLPLRPGVEQFIDDAYNEGIPVVILTAYSKSGDNIARSVMEKLGNDRIKKVSIVGIKEADQSLYGQLISGKVIASGLDEELAKEATRAASAERQRLAKEVASMLKLSVEIDTSLSESLDKIVAALHAGAECAGIPISNCVLVAGSQSGVAGAERAGMPCVVLRSSLTSRAEFPLAMATMDGFGGADLTIAKLRNLCKKKQPED
ncbi:CBBY-like protein [Cicer arietinum]|uniref:CBBY-like protein n=1 Tax=Cicer arietinum TaxID=3827 RepID=A0A1S2XAQ7_CICAR|nr:CBBY-like protein [Cicer arietinum]XP_012569441.1 CBBY-like protein [Cicer arietinum]